MITTTNFEARDLTIKDVLFAKDTCQVPRYQRPYAWDIDQATEFWSDLNSAEQAPFIGSLIFNYESYEKTGYIDIIDGQQRLITITIFVAVLRDLAKTIDKDRAGLFHRNDIAIEDGYTGKMTYRIIAGEQITEFLENQIQQFENGILDCEPQTIEEARVKKELPILSGKDR